jgi:hypothetical protein
MLSLSLSLHKKHYCRLVEPAEVHALLTAAADDDEEEL